MCFRDKAERQDLVLSACSSVRSVCLPLFKHTKRREGKTCERERRKDPSSYSLDGAQSLRRTAKRGKKKKKKKKGN